MIKSIRYGCGGRWNIKPIPPLAYTLGTREHKYLDELLKLLEPFCIAKVYVDANYAYESRIHSAVLITSKKNTQKIERNLSLYVAGERQKPEFIINNPLNMELVLEKFVLYFNDIYGDRTERFIEDDGRKVFLMYLRPIINGVGNY